MTANKGIKESMGSNEGGEPKGFVAINEPHTYGAALKRAKAAWGRYL